MTGLAAKSIGCLPISGAARETAAIGRQMARDGIDLQLTPSPLTHTSYPVTHTPFVHLFWVGTRQQSIYGGNFAILRSYQPLCH